MDEAPSTDEHLLAGALEGLTDYRLRRENLLNLVDSLTLQDVRDLMAKLSLVDFRTDILARLPTEVQLLVAENLNSSDIFTLLSVSRQWRDIWTSMDMIRHLSTRFFPESFRNALAGRDPTSTDDIAFKREFFMDAIRKRQRRAKGLVRSVLCHRWALETEDYFALNPLVHPDQDRALSETFVSHIHCPIYAHSVAYRDGKLAWQLGGRALPPDTSVIIVDDLHTKTRTLFRPENVLLHGHCARLQALGDQLVVAADGRTMYVWQLSSARLEVVTLPSQLSGCVTEGSSVGILTGGSDNAAVFLWTFSGLLTEIDLSVPRNIAAGYASKPPFPTEHRLCPRISWDMMFDPLQPESFFVVLTIDLSDTNTAAFLVTIHEYVQGKYKRSYTRYMPVSSTYRMVPYYMGCRRIGSDGLRGVIAVYDKGGGDDPPKHFSRPQVSLIGFNPISRRFNIQEYRIPFARGFQLPLPGQLQPEPLHCWSNQLTIFFQNILGGSFFGTLNDARNLPPRQFSALDSDDCFNENALSDITGLSLEEDQTSDTSSGSSVSPWVPSYVWATEHPAASREAQGIAYQLDCSGKAFNYLKAGYESTTLVGDNDFLLQMHFCGYAVFAFDADMGNRRDAADAIQPVSDFPGHSGFAESHIRSVPS